MPPIITLTTDFGEGSLYVAEMKGVILSIAPQALMIDVTHSIPPQDIRQGAIALEQTTPRFPTGSIHVAVVDPGVGTSRRIIYACINDQHYIAPDNGLLGLLTRRQAPSLFISLTNRAYWRSEASRTFHGRDIMAPAAAFLARGVPPAELGDAISQLAPLDWPAPVIENGRLKGEVCTIDSFGNLITNIDRGLLEGLGPSDCLRVSMGDRAITGIVATYGDRKPGELTALLGSSDRLEIAIINGSAKAVLAVEIGETVFVSSP